jgi:hypothetical protein
MRVSLEAITARLSCPADFWRSPELVNSTPSILGLFFHSSQLQGPLGLQLLLQLVTHFGQLL